MENATIRQKINVENLRERFLAYVQIDTQSSEKSDTYPSTLKQLDLCKKLLGELQAMGVENARMTEHGYVFASLPGNLPADHPVVVPAIGLIAHVDTSPDVSGKNVQPQIHANYDGGNIALPGDPREVILAAENPELADCLGHDIITSDGTTLLGADNKAGVSEIMTAIEFLLNEPGFLYGPVQIAFTVDEEVGAGVTHFDVEAFGARYAYTIDGGTAGEVEDETFSANTVDVTIHGVNVHPGYACDVMVNALKIATEFIAELPAGECSPETTKGREGYVHPNTINGNPGLVEMRFMVRDFTMEGLTEKVRLLENIRDKVQENWPKARIDLKVTESYRNMKYILQDYPHVVDYALEAVERAGIQPLRNLIRGGTDGTVLSYKGLPTPNIFTGGHKFHSKQEWVSLQDMTSAVATILHLLAIWSERGEVAD